MSDFGQLVGEKDNALVIAQIDLAIERFFDAVYNLGHTDAASDFLEDHPVIEGEVSESRAALRTVILEAVSKAQEA